MTVWNPLRAYEKRLQRMEARIENMNRVGEVTDVKFDKEKKRWYAKFKDGDFETDWRPWAAFAHGGIKVSMPPKKGMKVVNRNPSGVAESGYLEPYGYDPQNQSPHDKEDEYYVDVGGLSVKQAGEEHEIKKGPGKVRFFDGGNRSTVATGAFKVRTKNPKKDGETGAVQLEFGNDYFAIVKLPDGSVRIRTSRPIEVFPQKPISDDE